VEIDERERLPPNSAICDLRDPAEQALGRPCQAGGMGTSELSKTGDGERGLIYAFVLDGEGGTKTLDWEGVRSWTPTDGTLWVHLDYSDDEAKRWLMERSAIDAIAVEAMLDNDPRPSVTQFGDAVMMVLRGVNLNQGAEPEDMVSMRVWAQPERVITLRRRHVRVLTQVAAALGRGAGPKNASELLVALVEQVLEPVVKCVATLDDEIDACEELALAGDGVDPRSRLTAYRRTAVALRRFIGPQREAWSKLALLALPWVSEIDREQLELAANRLARSFEELEAARDRASVTHEELSSRVGELTNKRLYLLSIVTAVFLPLGFLTSLLGVNVGGVPGSSTEWGFWALCAAFAVAVLLQLRYFKRKGWL
jgi:zinc transporter